jgi:hypothetical protein
VREPWQRRDTATAVALVAAAFVARLLTVLMTEVLTSDAAAYLFAAREMGEGTWSVALRRGIHPGYPLMIALVGAATGNLERAGYAVSLIFSSLALVPWFVLVRDMFDRRVALLCGLFYATFTLLVREHADVLTEGFFHFLFLTAVALAWFALQDRGPARAALFGFVAGAAYLTRPEGLYLPLSIGGLAALATVRWWKAHAIDGWAPWRNAAAGVIVFAIAAWPLVVGFHGVTGRWVPLWRGSAAAAMTTLGAPPPPPELQTRGKKEAGVGAALRRLGVKAVQSKLAFVLPFAAAAFVLLRRRLPGLATAFLICLSAGYLIGPFLAAAGGYSTSHRHMLLPLIFLSPFAALPCVEMHGMLVRRRDPLLVHRACAGACAVFFVSMLAMSVRPRRTEDVPVRDAAAWLASRMEPDAVAYTNTDHAAWYLGRRPRMLPPSPDGFALQSGEYALVVDHDPCLAALRQHATCIFRNARASVFASARSSPR